VENQTQRGEKGAVRMATEIEKRFKPIITPEALPYLRIQQGRLNALEGQAWIDAYIQGLHDNLAAIRSFLPEKIDGVLDIGGGMGGIDALINHEFGKTIDVVIVDGDRDPPQVREKAQTYSNCAAAFEFLSLNGVVHPKFLIAPAEPQTKFDKGFLSTIEPVDLVLGVQSWGFHFPPSLHMPLAYAFSKPGTVWILDVRVQETGSPWATQLYSEERLEPIGQVNGLTDKYQRLAFKVVK
jgi:hypothetical protein